LVSSKIVNVIILLQKLKIKSKNSKNNTNHLKFFQEVQVAMNISVEISQLVIKIFTPKTTTTKALKSNSIIKPNLSFYLIHI